ncbi:dTDP-4-dehydrorhamnose reductase family protein [Leptospira jelokensis]|uniref:dTDP-4-dehydrorhamnose reductase family protein n=1 Tax=Leptospira jelokensis TaxID=2484931 RepID=UPI0010917FBA|nr:SDR family oxidoreductase [Leptospira jelokensis]TGL99227.1 SDR family oxidoreductase [Leptospira jelokensis]
MKILVLGGNGMFGNGLVQYLEPHFELAYTLKQNKEILDCKSKCYYNTDAFDLSSIMRVLKDFRPNIVINAIGIVKQKKEISHTTSIYLNSEFPYHLAQITEITNSRLILLSTDCVFSGKTGSYLESDAPDSTDVYGKSKALGEISDQDHVLTIRTSTIGMEMGSNKGLLEWFLSQKGLISGYKKAIYSGFTIKEFSNVLKLIFDRFSGISGLYHISSDPISKFDLLLYLKNRLNLTDLMIEEDNNFICDRSLNSERFRKETGYKPPEWSEMLDILAEEILVKKGY